MSEEKSAEMQIWDGMMDLWAKLDAAKPADRSELSRQYAIAITEFQKVMGFYRTFVMDGCSLEFLQSPE